MFPLVYFLISIAILGSVLAYGIVIWLHLLGRFVPAAKRAAEAIMVFGIGLLMRVQRPWLRCDIAIRLPKRAVGSPGLLLISNHRSHLDAFLVLSSVPGVRLFAKAPLFRIPFLGQAMWATGQIPVEQGRVDSFMEAIERLRLNLRRGETAHVFPEMTRCPVGYPGTQSFNLAPFHAAIQEGTPIVPVVVAGTDRVWPKGASLLRSGLVVKVRSLAPVLPASFGSAEELRAEVRRRIEQSWALLEAGQELA